MFTPGNMGTVTPASREKLLAEIAELEANSANPTKLAALRAVLKIQYGE